VDHGEIHQKLPRAWNAELPGSVFANPPFWVQLLMHAPPLDPAVRRVAGHVRASLEFWSGPVENRDVESSCMQEGGMLSKTPANDNPHAAERPKSIAA